MKESTLRKFVREEIKNTISEQAGFFEPEDIKPPFKQFVQAIFAQKRGAEIITYEDHGPDGVHIEVDLNSERFVLNKPIRRAMNRMLDSTRMEYVVSVEYGSVMIYPE